MGKGIEIPDCSYAGEPNPGGATRRGTPALHLSNLDDQRFDPALLHQVPLPLQEVREQFLAASARPNRSWRKLLYRVDAQSFVDVPPLVVQVCPPPMAGRDIYIPTRSELHERVPGLPSVDLDTSMSLGATSS